MWSKTFYDHRVVSYGGIFFELKKSIFSRMDNVTVFSFIRLVEKLIMYHFMENIEKIPNHVVNHEKNWKITGFSRGFHD